MNDLPLPVDEAPSPAGESRHRAWAVLPATAALAVAVALSVLVGSHAVSPAASVEALRDTADPLHGIVSARVDRTVLALLVGAALGLSGALLQGLTRNPLADPGILGISAGASFAVVVLVSTTTGATPAAYVGVAALGAAISATVVHGIAALTPGGMRPATVTIAGAAVTAALTSLTTAVLLGDHGTLETFRAWQVGSVGGRDLSVVALAAPVVLVAGAAAMTHSRALDALALGDDVAIALGTHPTRTRWVVGALAVVLAGTAVALSGPIGFVGLLVPHMVRGLAGPRHALVLPLSAVLGAALLALADTVGRVVLPPSEVQAGIMTAVVGLPVLVWVVRGGRR